ncbi:MAG: thymidine kinase [Taibaiella sp.]|nr:thymidine kinase [Taibaiella sp.]
MFIEPHHGSTNGWIEVICGSMFSGKTEELIRRLKRAYIAKLTVEIFKPALDTRYDTADVVSHDTSRIRSTPVSASQEILLLAGEADVVGIDEAQFFDDELPHVTSALASNGKRVIAAGLDMDFKGRPFGPMGDMMAVADYVTKLHAICMVCGGIALYSYRKVQHDSTMMLGELESYEPRCRTCFQPESSITL